MFVIPRLHNGGAERVIVDLANALSRTGRGVGIFVFEDGGDYRGSVDAGVSVHALGHRVKTVVEKTDAILRLAWVSRGYDVVVSGLELRTDDIVSACRSVHRLIFAKKLYLGMVHISISNLSARKSRVAGMKSTYRAFDAVIAVSEGVRTDILRLLDANVHVIYNPIDISAIRKRSVEYLEDAPANPFLVSVGRLELQKDQRTLIIAFKRFLELITAPYELFIIGRGGEEADLRVLCEEIGVGESVHFVGFQANPWKYMSRATAVVLSSIYEGFSLVIAESMACGTPVVATDCPFGPSELLAGGENGYLTTPGSPDELAAAMARVVSEPEEAARKIAQASRFVERLDTEVAATRYAALIDGL